MRDTNLRIGNTGEIPVVGLDTPHRREHAGRPNATPTPGGGRERGRPPLNGARRPVGRPSRALLVALLVALLAAACGTDLPSVVPSAAASPTPAVAVGPAGSPAAASVELTVFAAPSLADAMAIVKTAYEAATPGVTLTFSFGGSNAQRAQIEQGTPADVFLSADTDNAVALVDAGLTLGPEQPFAGNTLALVVPAGSKKVAKLPDLAKAGLRIAAAAKDDPISASTTALLAALGEMKGFPSGYAASVEKNIVSREDNVQAVLGKVQRGEADAGFVYATDVAGASDAVRGIKLPDTLNVPTTYAGVVVRTSTNGDAASAFLTWLSSADGQAILVQSGLLPPAQ